MIATVADFSVTNRFKENLNPAPCSGLSSFLHYVTYPAPGLHELGAVVFHVSQIKKLSYSRIK
jgi:hypothetical protein